MENYWWLIPVIILIIVVLFLVICLVWKNSPDVSAKEKCPSAEYPTIAENTSNDPNIVEVTLTSSDNEVQILSGDLTKMYNYNRSFPGPLIEAKRGDLLIVHFVNDISEPSTITFHGLLSDADQDGSELAQRAVQPGECYTYEIELFRAGLFYYHSDVNSRKQVSMGLFGAILVHDYHEDHRCRLPLTEKVLAFSDLKLDGNNQIDIQYSKNPETRLSQQLNGIRGNILLTNGVHNGCIHISRNIPIRLRMLNASADRFLKISIPGHDMLKIGGDQGLSSKPVLVKSGHGVLLTPGERADIVFVPRSEKVELVTELDSRGTQKVVEDCFGNLEVNDTDCSTERSEYTIKTSSSQISYNSEKATLVTFITREDSEQKLEVPLQLEPIRKIIVDQCTPVIPVVYGHYQCQDDLIYYAVSEKGQGIPYDSLTPRKAPLVFVDGVYIIEVTNYSELDNNFHLHGFSFQHIDTVKVTSKENTVIPNLVVENKDTILIPARPESSTNSKTVVRLAVEFKSKDRDIIAYGGNYGDDLYKKCDSAQSGGWVFASHILSNENLGQAGYIQIVSECYRERFLDQSVNTYSEFFTGDHTTCLTNSSKDDSSWDKTSNSFSNTTTDSYSDLSISEIESLTQSLIVCSCGSGLASHLCNCDTSLSY